MKHAVKLRNDFCALCGDNGRFTNLSYLQVDSEILAIRHSQSKPDRGIVTLSAETRNQHGDLLQTLKTNVIAFRKEPLPV